MPLEKRACARAKRVLLALLGEAQEEDWVEACAEEIDSFLNDTQTTEILSCSCIKCADGRRNSSSAPATHEIYSCVAKLVGSKRLFATCIIADLPFLIFSFLNKDFDDSRFDECISPTKLIEDVDLSLQDAKSLLDEKEKFFDGGRISLFTYMRSLRPGRETPLLQEEKNWIINEFLSVSDKLALDSDAAARKIPATARIKDLMIRDSPARPLDRKTQSVDGLGEQNVCMKSLGHLVLDLICFIAGGGRYVQELDKSRDSNIDWLKHIDRTDFDNIENSSKLFELVEIMTCPNEEFGVSKDDQGKENFKLISQHFHRIWPYHSNEHSHSDSERGRNSDATSVSSQGLGNPVEGQYLEIEPDVFRSMYVLYQREGHQQRKCRLRVFRSADNDGIRLDILSFDRDALKPRSYHASPMNIRFVPLYAYDNQYGLNEFSAKFQLASESSVILTIPYTFRFQSIEDVKKFQTAVTNRIIEKDIVLKEFSLVLRKKKRLIGTGSPQFYQFDAGRIQLWRVLDKRALKQIHETASLGVHGMRQYPLRAEIVLYSDHAVFVIGIKSFLRLKDLHDCSLRIETKERGSKASLEGRRLCTDGANHPGMPLFQSHSFNSQEGDGVVCDSIELKFLSKENRDELSQFLEERYNSPTSPSRS